MFGMADRRYFVSTGQRFGRGVVIEPEIRVPRPGNHMKADRGARLRCDCGMVYVTLLQSLRSGATASCGCVRRETTAQLRPGLGVVGEDNANARLTARKVQEIRQRRAAKEPRATLSREFDVSEASISHITSRRTWRHV